MSQHPNDLSKTKLKTIKCLKTKLQSVNANYVDEEVSLKIMFEENNFFFYVPYIKTQYSCFMVNVPHSVCVYPINQ